MTETTRWWWIRHAPVINPDGLIYGQRDLEADTGDAAAFAARAAGLPGGRPVLLTTPLRRTRQTLAALRAAPLAEGAGDPAVEPDLVEQSFGDWQGRPRVESTRALGRRHPFWLSPAATRPPGGESFVDLMARAATAIERLSRRPCRPRHRRRRPWRHESAPRWRRPWSWRRRRHCASRIDTLSLTRSTPSRPTDGPPAWRVAGVNLPAVGRRRGRDGHWPGRTHGVNALCLRIASRPAESRPVQPIRRIAPGRVRPERECARMAARRPAFSAPRRSAPPVARRPSPGLRFARRGRARGLVLTLARRWWGLAGPARAQGQRGAALVDRAQLTFQSMARGPEPAGDEHLMSAPHGPC